jgi:hypothetical protein
VKSGRKRNIIKTGRKNYLLLGRVIYSHTPPAVAHLGVPKSEGDMIFIEF